MKRCLMSILLSAALTLSACTVMNNIGDGADSAKLADALNYDLAEVYEAFEAAHYTALLFTGYAGNVYAQGEYIPDESDQTVKYDRFAICETFDELSKLTHSVFTPVLATELLSKKVLSDYPLYLEADGVLYRFGGYVSLWQGEPKSVEVKSVTENGDGTLNVKVEAVFDTYDGTDTVSVSHDYTCVEDGGMYKFTGYFPVLIELAIDDIYA